MRIFLTARIRSLLISAKGRNKIAGFGSQGTSVKGMPNCFHLGYSAADIEELVKEEVI